jgi:hypothetical protein
MGYEPFMVSFVSRTFPFQTLLRSRPTLLQYKQHSLTKQSTPTHYYTQQQQHQQQQMSRQSQPLHTASYSEPPVVVSRPATPKPEESNSRCTNTHECDQDHWDDWDYDYDYQDYGDDYCLNNQKTSGGGGGTTGCMQKTTKRQNERGGGGGRNNVYSSKHVRLQAAINKK